MENSEKVKTCDKSVTRRQLTPHSNNDGSAAWAANLETEQRRAAHAFPQFERHHRFSSL
ncbi:MAG: hypothetical protein ABMA01_03455 [Chthoniobacteraceae bacterium]